MRVRIEIERDGTNDRVITAEFASERELGGELTRIGLLIQSNGVDGAIGLLPPNVEARALKYLNFQV